MSTMSPQQVSLHDVFQWFNESSKLIVRRPAAFTLLSISFLILLYFGIQTMDPFIGLVPDVVPFALFMVFASIILSVSIAISISLSASVDLSDSIQIKSHLYAVMAVQKPICRLALMSLFVGSFYWVVAISLTPNTTMEESFGQVVSALNSTVNPLWTELQFTSAFLYFLFLSLFSLRLIFALPLMVFHQMSFRESQRLSHIAIVKNIKPMSVVLALWFGVFFVSLKFVPALSFVLLPMLGIFLYVAYRHIFLGLAKNQAAKPVTGKSHAVKVPS